MAASSWEGSPRAFVASALLSACFGCIVFIFGAADFPYFCENAAIPFKGLFSVLVFPGVFVLCEVEASSVSV